ncbi:MAG: hypothetical protein IKQ31_02425 [Clostridia bacterium]|nr:hypothetical protein [Clostridia bacterium]
MSKKEYDESNMAVPVFEEKKPKINNMRIYGADNPPYDPYKVISFRISGNKYHNLCDIGLGFIKSFTSGGYISRNERESRMKELKIELDMYEDEEMNKIANPNDKPRRAPLRQPYDPYKVLRNNIAKCVTGKEDRALCETILDFIEGATRGNKYDEAWQNRLILNMKNNYEQAEEAKSRVFADEMAM